MYVSLADYQHKETTTTKNRRSEMKTNEKSATNTQQQQASWRPISFIMLAQHVTKTQRRESHRCSVHKSRVTAARAQEVFFLFIL